MLKILTVTFLLTLGSSAFAEPMKFSMDCVGSASESCFLIAEGEITKDSPEAFKRLADGGAFDGGQVLFNSPGGSLDAGLELGRLIREYKLFTVVGDGASVKRHDAFPSGGKCESACAYAFLGGTRRTLTKGAKLGFHQFSLNKKSSEVVAQIGKVMAQSQKFSGIAISYLVEMGIDARLFALASEAGSDEMFYPTEATAEKYNVITPRGYAPFFMEPYGKGVVAAAKRNTPAGAYDSVYQVTTFCSKGDAKLLFTAVGFAPDRSVSFHLEVDSGKYTIPPNRVSTRKNAKDGYLEVILTDRESKALTNTTTLRTYFDYSRAEGWGYSTSLELSDLDRKMIAASYRLCL
ncbi:MAG: hypothetical protein ACI84R_000969 [Candidatus Azotimanducaceae bacterium]